MTFYPHYIDPGEMNNSKKWIIALEDTIAIKLFVLKMKDRPARSSNWFIYSIKMLIFYMGCFAQVTLLLVLGMILRILFNSPFFNK